MSIYCKIEHMTPKLETSKACPGFGNLLERRNYLLESFF